MMTRNEREYWSERSDDGERRVSLPQHGAVSCCSPITINTARGKVSFEQRVQAHPAQFDIDSDDAIALWYSPTELIAIKEDARNTLRTFRNAGMVMALLNDEEFSIRGLEDWGNPGFVNDNRIKVYNIIHAILDEQANQKKMGISDPKGLQVLSSACTRHAKERALLMGRNDEQEMRCITRRLSMTIPDLVKKDSDSKLQASATFTECMSESFTNLALTRQQVKPSMARSA